MSRTGKKQPKKSPRLNDRFSAGVLPLSIAHIVRPKQVLALLAASVPGLALAGPQGGQVVAGSASINSPNANTTNIHQASNRAAIDWQSFSLGSSDYVQFFQPNSSSVALNRVVGGNPSSILGNLTANGQVFLVNPAGVYFGQGATVDVAGLVATTMNIGNDDFMAGNYLFSRDISSPDNATVINEGILAARDGGYVVLSGDYVNNNGIISAQLGTVAMAAGAGMTLDIAGDNLINFTVDAASVSELAGVDNAGDLYADGGRVIMTAEVADNLVNAAVNNSGRVEAQGVLEQDGAIYLVANGGDVVNSGIVDASGPDGDGGFVRIRSTDDVTLTSTSEIDATGGTGEGGIVRVIAEQDLDFQAGADIDARGAVGEQGGFVEVSGHGGLALQGSVRIGNNGQLLIDPANLTISGGTSGGSTPGNAVIGEFFIENALQSGSGTSGANVALVATDSIIFNGSFSGGDLNGVNGYGGIGGDLFIGIGSIVGSPNGFFSNSTDNPPGTFPDFVADPSGTVDLNGVKLLLDGNLTIRSGTTSGDIVGIDSISASNVVLSAAGGSIAPSSSSLNINATGNVDITATGISFSGSSADLSITAGGSVNINTNIDLIGSGGESNGASLSINGNGLAINGDINVFASGSSFPPPAQIDLQGGSGSLIVNGDVSADANFFGTGASFSPGSATITYAGASILQNGNVSAFVQGSASSGSGLPLNANISMTASNGSVTINNGVIQASASAFGSSSPGINSVSATADVSLSATSGDIVITNADIIATAAASNGQNASTGGSTPQATAIATVQMATSGSGTITISGGSINDGDVLATADARATGSSATISGSSVISPQSTAGAKINIVGGGTVTTNGNLLAVADGHIAHSFGGTPSGGANQGAQVHIQSLNSDVIVNNAVAAQFGLGTGDVAAQAFANLNLMTGFVTGAGTTTSYHGGGDILLNGGASLLASASGEFIGNAGIELWAVETDPAGPAPISGGGNIIINGSGLTAVGTEAADGGTSAQFADADINIEALGGTITVNAPVLSSAVGNDATGSNVFAEVNIGGGLIGGAGGPGEVTITDTVEARVTGSGATSAGITIEGGGDIQTSGAGLLVAHNVLFNPSYTSSGSSVIAGGNSNAQFDVATNAPVVGIGNNLTSLVVDNSAHAGTLSIGAGATYSYSSGVVFNGPATPSGLVDITTGTGIVGDNLKLLTPIQGGAVTLTANAMFPSAGFFDVSATAGDINLNGDVFSLIVLVDAVGGGVTINGDMFGGRPGLFSAPPIPIPLSGGGIAVTADGAVTINGNLLSSVSSGTASFGSHPSFPNNDVFNVVQSRTSTVDITGDMTAVSTVVTGNEVNVSNMVLTGDSDGYGGPAFNPAQAGGDITINGTLHTQIDNASGKTVGRSRVIAYSDGAGAGGNINLNSGALRTVITGSASTASGFADAFAVGGDVTQAAGQVIEANISGVNVHASGGLSTGALGRANSSGRSFGTVIQRPGFGDIFQNGQILVSGQTVSSSGSVDVRGGANAASDSAGGPGGNVTLGATGLIDLDATGGGTVTPDRSRAIGGAFAGNGDMIQQAGHIIDGFASGGGGSSASDDIVAAVGLRTGNFLNDSNGVVVTPGSGDITQSGTITALASGSAAASGGSTVVLAVAGVSATGDGATPLSGGNVTLSATGSISATAKGFGPGSEASYADAEAIARGGASLTQQAGHSMIATATALDLTGPATQGYADADIQLHTGLDPFTATNASFVAGGNILLAGNNVATATANQGATDAQLSVIANGDGANGGSITVTGGSFTVSGNKTGATTGGSFSYAAADLFFEAGDGAIDIDAGVTLGATATTAAGSAFAEAGFIGGSGLSIDSAPTLSATGGTVNETEITLAAGGLATGTAVLTADAIFYNEKGTDSLGTFSYGSAGASFNLVTDASKHIVSDNLSAVTIDNSAFLGTTLLGLGASYTLGTPSFTFSGGGGLENVSFTAGGDLDLISDINVGSLSINADAINKSSAFAAPTNSLTINTAGDLSITATGLFVSGSGANLLMSAAGNLQLDAPVVVSANGVAFDATIDLTAANNLTINQSITATATGSLGAEALVNLTGGTSGGAVNINSDVTAMAQALGSIGSATEDFEATINIIGAGTSDVFLNSGTLLAQVVDGGAIAGHNNFARVEVQAIGGNLTQAAGHTAIADATGGTRDATNTTISRVKLEADDQVNVAGTVTATAAGEAFTTAVVSIAETTGAISGAVNVTGANITVAATDFGSPLSGSSQSRNAILEIRALEGDVSVDAATTLATSTITVNRAFASASIGADAGQLNLAADLNLLASGFRATESFFVYGGTGITGGGNLSGNAIATAGNASALINISSTSGNVSLGSLSANASGTQANATLDITTTGLLTVNSDIDAVGIASTGTASAQVLLNAGSMDLAADITAQVTGPGLLTEQVLLDAAGPVSNTFGGSNTITAATLGLNTIGGSSTAVFGSAANPIRVDVSNVDLGTLGGAFLNNAFAGTFQLDPASIAGQNLTMTLAGGLNLGSSLGLTSLNVDGLDLDVGDVITADAPHVQITSTGGIAIKAAGFNLTGSISSASLTMFASSDIVIDTPINVTDNGATPNVFVDIRSLQSLTINQAIMAEATGSSGASVIVDLAGGSIGGTVNINADISAIARAQGTGGPFPFDPTINIVGEGSADVFLNTGTLLAKVSDGGPTTPIGGNALVHVEALGGDFTQAATHVAKAEATGGTNATNATVELTADDQVNVAGTVIADAKGAASASALAHIHEHGGATAGAVNVSGANITATVADFGSPSSGTRLATLEIISEQGGVSVDGATTLVNSAITATGSAFATGNIRGTGGVVNFASTLLTLASAGSFASALVDIDAGSGITGGGNFQADAVESGTGTALSRVHVDTAAGNATVGDLAVNASGGLATASIDVGQNIVPIPGNLTIGNISGNVTGNSNDGHLNIDLDADNGITVSGSINGVASAGANALADAEVFIDINTGSAGANISVVGPITATATAVQSSASASVDVFGQGNVTLGNVTVTANGNNDAFSSISANAVGGNLTAGNLTVVATENSSDAEANINLDASTGTLVVGNLSATGSGQGSGSADIDVDAQTVTVGNVTALATGATDEAFATIDVHATSGNATLATVLASATASSFGEASIDIDANNGAVVTGAVTATGIAASDASGSIDIFATGNIITGPLTVTVDGGSDSADADLDVQSQNGSVTINGGLTVDVQADDYIGTVSASVRTGGGGFTGGDITINGNAQVMTLGSYASAELNITAFSNAGAGGDIIVNGAAIAKALWQAGTSNSDNTALVDLDAQAGSLTVTGQTLAQASHQNSESANAFIVLQADTGVNVQNVSALATAPSSDANASVSILANTGAVNAGTVTVTALADTASGDAFAGFDATTLAGAITVNGAINLLASGGTGTFDDVNAIASLLTPTNLQLNGPVSINTVGGTGLSDGAIFSGFANNVTANGLISVISQTPNTEALITFDGDAGGGPGNGTLIASTSTSNLEIADFANTTVENISSITPLSLSLNGSLGNLSVTTSGDMDFTGQAAIATGNVLLGATGNLDVSLSTVSASVVDLIAGNGDLLLNGASIVGTGGVFLSAGGSVLNGPALIDGGMVGVFAGQDIDLSLSDIFVGTASDATRLPGDPLVTDFLLANGISVPSKNPNALFLANNSVKIGNLDMSGHYLWVESNNISFTGTVNTPQNVLAQLLPSDPLASIGVTQSESFSQLVNYSNLDHFEPFTGTTIAVGASFINSDITIEEINVGSKNMLFVTNGVVEGDDLVTTTGLVAVLSLAPVTDQTIDIINTIDSVDDLASGKTETPADEPPDEEDDEEDDDDEADTGTDGGSEGSDALIEQDDNPDESLECA